MWLNQKISLNIIFTVAPEDIGRIIGKQGRVAKAIRTIVYGGSHQRPQKGPFKYH